MRAKYEQSKKGVTKELFSEIGVKKWSYMTFHTVKIWKIWGKIWKTWSIT